MSKNIIINLKKKDDDSNSDANLDANFDANSDDKKATQFDTSSPEPSLPIGILDIKNSLTFSAMFVVISETINPGETQLIVIFFFEYSIARLFDIPIIAALDAE